MGLALIVVAATAAPGGRRTSYATDAAGALFSLAMSTVLIGHDPEHFRANMVRVAMVVVSAETLVEFTQPPEEDCAADQLLLPSHMLIKMIAELGLVAPGLLGWRTGAYAVVNVARAASATHLVWRTGQGVAGHQLHVYVQTVAVLIGCATSRVFRQLYDKEMELAATQAELARLLEASRESNERREYEIQMNRKLWGWDSVTCTSEADESDIRPATHYTAKLSKCGSHHTTKLGGHAASA